MLIILDILQPDIISQRYIINPVMVESYDSRILRFVRFEDSTESSNRILKSSIGRIEYRIESSILQAPNRISNRILKSSEAGIEYQIES